MTNKTSRRNILATAAFTGIIYLLKWQLGFESMIMVVLSALFYTYCETEK